jgi:transketolase
MLAISDLNVKMVGSHSGVSIGEDGPSQMALEDLSMMTSQPYITVLYPSDAVCAEHLVAAAASRPGPVYIRTTRPKLPVLYDNHDTFPIGGLKVLRRTSGDTATVIGAGVTLYEALKAHDLLKAEGVSIRVIDLYSVQPIDSTALLRAARETGRLITVEDHYPAGGIGDAVARVVAAEGYVVTRLAVRQIPRSGKPEELLEKYGISASHIVAAIKAPVAGATSAS